MITIEEIRNKAAQVSLANTVVEKDYALGWLLWGIYQHGKIKEDWVFKGGTCLKKCYFETYRFSEDLDFSFRGSNQPKDNDLVTIFSEISDLILQESGLEFLKESIKFESFQNPRGSISIQGGIKYRSIVRSQVGINHMQRIKIDLTLDEPVVLHPVINKVDHPYSDRPDDGISVSSYAYEEVFAEKVRALAERLRPRDLYDVVHLFRRRDLKPNRQKVNDTLVSKCQLRGIEIPTIENIRTHKNILLLESEWSNQLKHQIQVLPNFQSFLDELPIALDWIRGIEAKEQEPFVDTRFGEAEGEVNIEPVQTLVPPGPSSSYLDKIRFAASNRFIVNLKYGGDWREIEPYALARSSDGNLLLRSIRTNNREARTYRWDRIQDIMVTEKIFTPRYRVEITSSGNLPIHQLTSKQRSRKFTYSGRIRSQGPVYIYRCPNCNRTFRRKVHTGSAQLRAHKDKFGYACSGRRGYYERSDY